MSLPIGMYRRAFSYDDALEDPTPMTPPPSDMGSMPWKPVIPERKYQHLAKVEEGEPGVSPRAPAPPSVSDSEKAPVVKAKATHVIMSSLITKQTQENIQRFEQQAGLRDAGYTPHKGLTTEETKYLRVAEALHQLKLQRGFAIQAYRGAQKPSPMEVMRAQAARRAEEPAASKPPKMDIPATEGTRQLPRAHSLKPRDLNVLTPTGF
ncbi:unnamed protein product [Rangifer tarandus platyrhynchus]|uniref:Uncharacterized protein n=3 Tax=Rangifer tarandus platyrhynchus TaxID=3082113 RepID=A0AC59YBY4_RANTA|nr:unnamed protein product [Rangifer tarandus platyrhynchus]CAI9692956.1 unnamed protein product [Rangifer tarandus platyrhynchus]